jgi:hypothetical protein
MADVYELDAQTGVAVERGYTADEQTQREKDQAKHVLLEQAKQERLAAREALLTRLGITAEEAQLLLGGQ